MADLHIILIPEAMSPAGQEFAERYAEHLRGMDFLGEFPDENDLIFWWSPDKPYIPSLSNKHVVHSTEPDDAHWGEIHRGKLLAGLLHGRDVTTVVVANDLLLHGTQQHQVRNRTNQIVHWIRTSGYHFVVLLFIVPDMVQWPQSTGRDILAAAQAVIMTHNENAGSFLKNRDGAQNTLMLP